MKILNATSESNFLPTHHKIKIESHIGFAPNEYKWQYSTSSFFGYPINFQDLPQFDGMSSIEVDAFDILGANAEDYLGQTVYIRQKDPCGGTYHSNIAQFTVLPSAPKVINHGPSVKTSCYDANDGQYRIYFDRPLNSARNEYITIGLTGSNNEGAINVDFTNIYQLEPDNSFNLTNLPAGTYVLKIRGEIYPGTDREVDIYSETTVTPVVFTIDKNPPVDFSLTKTDVWCYQGTDGEIHINASGGTGKGYEYQLNNGDWIPFADVNTTTHSIKNLPQGDYVLKVRDANQCVAKIQGQNPNGDVALGAEKEIPITLTAPQTALSLVYTLVTEPLYHGASNGKLVAKIDGGTIFDNNTYWFEWKNSAGVVIPTTTQFTSGSFYITADGIPADVYTLTIRDKNHTNATDKGNCTIIDSEIELTQPDPIQASIVLIKPISCHVDNEFGNETDFNPIDGQRDESQDGILKIEVTGGKQFSGNQNGGKPYKYFWKKQDTNGVWQSFTNPENTFSQLSDGNYAINIEDANGIVIGVYANNALVEATDLIYYLQQPDKLELTFTSVAATCFGDDGTAQATVTGGTPPYTYAWSNGETTASISSLIPLTYFVTITDARGCLIQGNVVVSQPEHIQITETIRPLLCYNATDASIEMHITGGTAPYQYLWNTGATTNKIENLASGNYTISVTDAQGCIYIKEYTIKNPEEIIIDLGEDRTLCNGQTLPLDVTLVNESGTLYSWTSDNGFSSNDARVVLSDAGTYTITALTPNGCTITDSINIKRSNFDIDAEFLLTSQAYVNEEVILVNTSNPKGQTTEWLLNDSDASIIDESEDYITLKFSEEGKHLITIKQTQGDCFMQFDKEIIVEANNGQYNPTNANASFIKEFTVTPNPSDGNFEVVIVFEENSTAKLRMYSVNGQLASADRSLPSAKAHNVVYNAQLAAGTYILVLETPYQTLTKKLIIY